jgi:hypothetical protein
MTKAELKEAIAIASKLPRPSPVTTRAQTESDRLVSRVESLNGYHKNRKPASNPQKRLNCYPFANWWRKAVERAK